MADKPQSFKNHAKFVPLFHGFAFPVSAINAVWQLMRAFKSPSWDTAIAALLGIAIVVMFFYARIFALTVQDRVIRLEMRLRLRDVLPADLQPRVPELTPRQLVSLRFASDGELPALVRRVLDDRLTDGKAIKALVQDWQGDHLRA
jgi:Family of unknown function (DUF6526)